MKKLYLLFLFISLGVFSQNVTITKIIETECSSPFVKTVELYVDGTVDFANDDIVLNYMQNGDAWSARQIDISGLGEQTNSFVYLVRDIPLMQAEFPSTTFNSTNTLDVGTSTNGNDGYQIVMNGAVISQFGETETDGDGTSWDHKDAVATRKDNVPDTGSFNINDWEFTAVESTVGQTACKGGDGLEAWFATLGGTFPLGSGSGWTPDCTTFLGSTSVTCNSEGIGESDDTYTATLSFTGANTGNTFTVTSTAGTVGGDDPTTTESGTITISDIPEGTDITVSVSDTGDGGVCDVSSEILSPGCVPLVLNETLYDPPAGSDGDANNDGTRDFSDDEFIEFFNNSNQELDISGYKIFDTDVLSSNVPRHEVPENTVIPANGVYVVFGGGTPTGSFGDAIVHVASSGTLNLNNASDEITVKNASDQVVIKFNSEDFDLNFGADQSITRSPDITGDYVLHTTANPDLLFSPGLRVNGETLSIDDELFNSEIVLYPNPVRDGQLFIKTNKQIDDIKIYNLLGAKVLEQNSFNGQSLKLSGLNTGAYIIRVNTEGKYINKKIIIK